jgi:ribosomal protein L11 methyltransferase
VNTEEPAAGAVRIEIPAAQAARFEEHDGDFFDVMGDLPCSSTRRPDGTLLVWVERKDLGEALAALASAGARSVFTFEEKNIDWVVESAALRRSVLVERYLLDPHEGVLATVPGPGVRRLFLPAARAFGTGSHESTRLALRLLLAENFRGKRVLDVGCGTGTLAFVASLEGATHTVAFDLDIDAAVATREQAAANQIAKLSWFAGPLEGLRAAPHFDVVVANMIQEEVAPLLPGLRARLRKGGRLVTSGQLVERKAEWEAVLRKNAFRPVRVLTENEWLGMTSEAPEDLSSNE